MHSATTFIATRQRRQSANICAYSGAHSLAYHRLADSAKAVKLPCANGKAAAAALAAQGICVSTPRLLLRLHVFLALLLHLPPVLQAVGSAGECRLFLGGSLDEENVFLLRFQ